MKTSELQINDWVLQRDGGYAKVIGIEHMGTVDTSRGITIDMYLNPVPLTPEILVLNGFVKIDEYYYQRINGDDVNVRLPKEDFMYPYVDITYTSLIHNPENVTEVSHSNGLIFPEKIYVHQFQQVLRICGLIEFANNLKVE